MQLSDGQVKSIVEHLIRRLAAFLIILYGSAVQDKLRADSDVDLAFLSQDVFSDYDIFLVAQELASILHRDVDLIDLRKASTVLQAQVVAKGKVLFCSDERERMVFAMTALKKYAKLNEERRCILDKIIERGAVYEK